jgi:hypothetical protein
MSIGEVNVQDLQKKIVPSRSLGMQYLGRVSEADYYQSGHVRIGVEYQAGSHRLSFFCERKRLEPSFCIGIAMSMAPEMVWQVDHKHSRNPRFIRLWAEAVS